MAANEKGNGDKEDRAEKTEPKEAAASEQPAVEGGGSPGPVQEDRPKDDQDGQPKTGEKPEPGSAPRARPTPAPERKGARWADPIFRFDARWTWFEARLITFVLLWQLTALVAWVLLNGLSESVTQSAGVVFRAAIFGI